MYWHIKSAFMSMSFTGSVFETTQHTEELAVKNSCSIVTASLMMFKLRTVSGGDRDGAEDG
jgi:hypothetical protein